MWCQTPSASNQQPGNHSLLQPVVTLQRDHHILHVCVYKYVRVPLRTTQMESVLAGLLLPSSVLYVISAPRWSTMHLPHGRIHVLGRLMCLQSLCTCSCDCARPSSVCVGVRERSGARRHFLFAGVPVLTGSRVVCFSASLSEAPGYWLCVCLQSSAFLCITQCVCVHGSGRMIITLSSVLNCCCTLKSVAHKHTQSNDVSGLCACTCTFRLLCFPNVVAVILDPLSKRRLKFQSLRNFYLLLF